MNGRDRSRRDRLQASVICAAIACLSGSPLWLLLLGRVTLT